MKNVDKQMLKTARRNMSGQILRNEAIWNLIAF